jgi:hypothetical protein
MSIAASEMRILADGPETENGDFLTSDPLWSWLKLVVSGDHLPTQNYREGTFRKVTACAPGTVLK